jgi:hypothetical protein
MLGFDSRRLHHSSPGKPGVALALRGLLQVSPDSWRLNARSSKPIAASSVVGLRCMYLIVVLMLAWPASFWIAAGEAPSAASIEQNV